MRIPIATLTVLLSAHIQAATPLLTFTPTTATSVEISAGDVKTVEYRVTNQSRKIFTLDLQAIVGVRQLQGQNGECEINQPLRHRESCLLTLEVDGSKISQSVQGGPIVCQAGNRNSCYQPASQYSLRIKLMDD